jgi:hypothetical protein
MGKETATITTTEVSKFSHEIHDFNLHDLKFGVRCTVSAQNHRARLLRRNDISLPLKGEAIPLQAFTGPEGSRRLKLLDFKTIGT